MDNKPKKGNAAFSLIEMLVVIAIIVVLAGMVVGLTGVVGDKKKVARTRAEIARVSLMIDTYKTKKGVYPPGNPTNPNDPTNTSLFYELAGANVNASGDYVIPIGNVVVTATALQNACGVGGVVNSDRTGNAEDRASVLRLLTEVKSDQTNSITVNGSTVVVLVAPVEGPNGRKVNPLYYRAGTNAVHNPGQFDLWAEIKSGDKTRIIGNWKD